MTIDYRVFPSWESFEREALALLAGHMAAPDPGPHAVMLSGGQTPFPVYAAAARQGIRADGNLRVLFSDERMVPPESTESNSGRIQPFLEAVGLTPDRILRVHSELSPAAAAERYEGELSAFLESGGRIDLGLLGLGPDGHTASLFGDDDLRRAEGHLAIPVTRPAGPARVSVTPSFLARIERLMFWVRGAEKRAVLDRLLRDPESVLAGRALRAARTCAVWEVP